MRGQLKGGTNAASAPDLPSDYTKAAKVVAERLYDGGGSGGTNVSDA